MLSKENKGNFLDDTSEATQSEQADKRLTISGPLEDILRRNNATEQPVPRLWSGFSSSNSDIVRRDPEDDGEQAAAAAAAATITATSRRAFELANTPARTPNIFHITAPYVPYPIELDVLPRSPLPAHQPLTHNVRPLPPPVPQRGNYNGSSSGNNSHLQPLPMHTAHRHPHPDFGDDSTMVGDKAEVETLRSDLSFLNTDSDSASYNEGQWIPMDNKAVGLLGRHWE
jgi:hypothetical protein